MPPRPHPRPGPRPHPRPRPGPRGGYGYPYPGYPEREVVVLDVQEVRAAPAPLAMFQVVSKIFENGLPFPVVTHIFSGTTLSQAQGFYRAHLKSDAFLRACVNGSFGRMFCREEHYAARWNGQRWERTGG